MSSSTVGIDVSKAKLDVALLSELGKYRSKVFANYGRYFFPIPVNTNFRAASGIVDKSDYFTFTGIDTSNGRPPLSKLARLALSPMQAKKVSIIGAERLVSNLT